MMKKVVVFLITFFLMYETGRRFGHSRAYDQGRFDAQNECIVEQEFTDQLKLESIVEGLKWECSQQKNFIINNCSEYCGAITI